MWRSGCRSYISVSASFVWRCLSGSTAAPFPHPAHRTGQADYRPKVHRRGDSQADWPRRLWRNGHISEYARRFGDALLNAKASHWTPIIVWVSAVSHRCSVANTNPPASNARPVGMHVRRGGLPGWRSIGRSVPRSASPTWADSSGQTCLGRLVKRPTFFTRKRKAARGGAAQ
jgi:hypothetical protein